jgi:hypothetical protein
MAWISVAAVVFQPYKLSGSRTCRLGMPDLNMHLIYHDRAPVEAPKHELLDFLAKEQGFRLKNLSGNARKGSEYCRKPS